MEIMFPFRGNGYLVSKLFCAMQLDMYVNKSVKGYRSLAYSLEYCTLYVPRSFNAQKRAVFPLFRNMITSQNTVTEIFFIFLNSATLLLDENLERK